METRLELLEPALAQRVKLADPVKRREFVVKIIRYAMERSPYKNDLIEKIILELEQGHFGKATRHKKAVEELLEELDNTQNTIRKQSESSEADIDNYLALSTFARVVNTVLYALDPDSYIAANESAYEAYTIANDLDAINAILT